MVAFDPNLICARVMPDSTTRHWVRLTDPLSGDLSLSVHGANPFVVVGDIVVSEKYWRPPERDESGPADGGLIEGIRVVARGRGSQSVPVEPGQDVDIELLCGRAPGDGSQKWLVGLLVAHLGAATSELPLYFAVGGDEVQPLVSEEQLSVWMNPGQIRNTSFSIVSAPSSAEVRACLIGGAPTIHSSEIFVEKEEYLSYEDALERGLLEGMDADRLELIKDQGYSHMVEIAHVTGAEPVRVEAGNQVRVNIACRAPESGGGVARAKVALIAPQWKPVIVPITAIVQNVSVKLDRDTFVLAQGQRIGLDVTVSSGLGAAGYVMFKLSGGDDILTLPPPAPLVYGPGVKVKASLPLSVSPAAPLGPVRNIQLVALFSAEGVGDAITTSIDLHVTVVPSKTEVLVSPTRIGVPTGSFGSLTVTVLSGGGPKEIRLTPGPLPPGVTVESATVTLRPTDTEVQHVLRVDAHPDNARLVSGLPVVINWKSNNGQQSGAAVFRLTVLQRPESRTFSKPIVTPSGVPLGGHAEFVINSDGSARFKGHMRATGLFSYEFTVRAVLQSGSGGLALIHQKSGRVYGTDTPGPRQFDWDEDASDQLIAGMWPDFRAGSIAVSRSSEMIGTIGTAAELVGDVLEFAVASSILLPFGPAGQCLAGLVLVGSEIGDAADTSLIGPGALSGLLLAGGAAFLVGPTVIIPAFVGGALIGEALVKHRGLNSAEKAAAHRLFQDTLPWDRIRLTNLSGSNNAMMTIPINDGSILINLGGAFDDPLAYTNPPQFPTYLQPGQAFMHELTHAWQIAHKSFKSEYFWKGAVDQMIGFTSGDPETPYRYGPAGEPWRFYGLEEQAAIVEEWWAGTTYRSAGQFPPGSVRPRESENDPYFRYISQNIRMGEPL
ncbi:COG1470 family protein [Actinomadura kijaniata]|uniref:COG1470 family protein n=1 Tax=Actinomadura kijaniata TaxID=46161 RepID=UPI003F1B3B29